MILFFRGGGGSYVSLPALFIFHGLGFDLYVSTLKLAGVSSLVRNRESTHLFAHSWIRASNA
jgi:hypothetical protein